MTKRDSHYLGHRQRLRDRFLKADLDGLADHEVVELLLTLAIPRSDVKQPAKASIERFGNLRGIFDASLEELRAVAGIGSVAPVALQIIRAAATLYLRQAAEGRDAFADPGHLAAFWRMRIGALRDEGFEVAHLDAARRLELLDFETSPRPTESPELLAAYERQLCTYAHILERRHGRRVDRLFLYWTSEPRKHEDGHLFPYDPGRVEEAGRYFDEVIGRIQAKEFAVKTPPEPGICKECDLRLLCHAEGILPAEHVRPVGGAQPVRQSSRRSMRP